MRKATFILFIIITCSSSLFAQKAEVRSGVIGGVSMDWVHADTYPGMRAFFFEGKKATFHVGYQFQFDFQKPWTIDAALLYGQKRCKIREGYAAAANFTRVLPGNYLALNGVINRRLLKNLKVGVGVEPTLHFKNHDFFDLPVKAAFDVPLVVKAAYSFKYFDVALAYKHGFCNVFKDIPSINKAMTRDLQLSIFVPIFR